MRKILYIVRKEFRQIFRNRFMIPIIFVMPFIQLFVLAYAASFEIKDLRIFIVDQDLSNTSRSLIHHLEGSPYYIVTGQSFDMNSAYRSIEKDDADLVLRFAPQFEKALYNENTASIQIMINAINGTKAALASQYIQQSLQDFNQKVRLEEFPELTGLGQGGIDIRFRHWFNPTGDYKIFMVPGILVLLVTMIGAFLTGINIVREKEIGTIEQLNVTTIKKHEFIIGKLIPFWIIALIELSIGLFIAWWFFDVPFEGGLLIIFLFANIYLPVVLGLGMFISTFTKTQQQAMFLTWFLLVIFILMSGLFTPIEYMPDWAIWLTYINPVAYFVEFMRLVMLKGSGYEDVMGLFGAMAIYALVINTMAVWNYKKVVS